MMLIYLVFFCVFFGETGGFNNGSNITNGNPCNVQDVPSLKLLFCDTFENEDKKLDDSNQVIPAGATCEFLVMNSTYVIIMHCEDQGWHTTEIFNSKSSTKRHKRFVEWIVVGLLVVFGATCLFGGCGTKYPRDRNPPHIQCDQGPTKLADPIQVNTVVSWKEPKAHDTEDGEISPSRSGSQPGVLFTEGTSSVRYLARDKAGNTDFCDIDITVVVKRCPPVSNIKDGYYRCHPSSDMVQGTTCHFGCYRGYKLTGPSLMECRGYLDNNPGKWSNQQPKCEPLQCPNVGPVTKHMKMSCTNGRYYRSKCEFSCKEGFDISPGQTRVMLCTENGQWRGSVPTCIDVQPPVLKDCVGYQVGFTDRGSDRGMCLTFRIPSVTDNESKNIQPQLLTKVNPKSLLQAGVYDIVYTANDDAGNKAVDCKIKLVIKMITCPRIYPTADSSVTCDTGSRYGSNCEFACQSSGVLNGTKYVTCERNGNDAYGSWTWAGHQPFCKNAKRCLETLRTPANGAIACDYWLGGKFCHMFCRERFDVPNGMLPGNGNDMFVCGESGKWSPSTTVPDCARVVGGRRFRYKLNLEFHFSGNCHDPEVVLEIQQAFISHWKTSGYQEGCLHEIEKCNPSNIQVRCGMNKKRSVDLRISFDVEMESINNTIEDEQFSHFILQQYTAIQNLKLALQNGDLNFEADNITLQAENLTYTILQLECEEGTLITNNGRGCAKCSQGTFYDKVNRTCSACPKGTYQELEGQLSCKLCPVGNTTREVGATTVNQCEDACPPGSWSLDGTPPCSFCPKGSFQIFHGSTGCEDCPFSETTDLDGAEAKDKCKNFDIYLSTVNGSVEREFETSGDFYVTMWVQIEMYLSENLLLSVTHEDKKNAIDVSVKDDFIAVAIIRSNYSKVDILPFRKWFSLMLHVTNESVELISSNSTERMIHDLDIKSGSWKLVVGGGVIGKFSQLNIYSKTLSIDNEYISKCFNNVSGDLLNWKSFESTLVSDVDVNVPSDCDDTDECNSSPCLNGNCTDELNGYTCTCFYGFEGDQCQHNIDDCGDNACDINGTCIDGPASYTCDCLYGFTGELCEIKMVDGEWGEWSNWTSCSVTCDNGTITRRRLCNDPNPDNGGQYCVGNDTEIDECSESECPYCMPLTQPENAILDCENDTDIGKINCTLLCEEGFKFDHDPKDFYYCGPETLFQWDIQTNDNPLVRLPSCTELKNSSMLKISYSANYADLVCGKSSRVHNVQTVVKETVKSTFKKAPCAQDNTSRISSLDILNCSNTHREKREVDLPNAGFEVEFECNSEKHGSEECRDILMNAFEHMVNKTIEGLLDSEIESTVYHIDTDTLRVDSKVECSGGMTAADYRCVPCSKGRYESDGECMLCDFGSYQDQTGTSYCNKCPTGTSTLGKGSFNVTDCSVQVDILEDGLSGMLIGLICSLVGAAVVIAVLFVRVQWMKSHKLYDFTSNLTGETRLQDASEEVCDEIELKKVSFHS